jgi:hypothetical protein
MKSPATPLILLVGCIILLLNLAIHATILLFPYVKRLARVIYSQTKAYLSALLVTTEAKATATAYYCYPLDGEGFLDTFLGVAVADISWTIASISGRLSKICE